MGTYTRAYLKDRINAGIKGKIGMITSVDSLINQAVRIAYNDIDLRSAKRASTASPNLFSGIYSYPAPADLKANGIIDIRPRVNRTRQSVFNLTTPEQFDRNKGSDNLSCAVSTEDSIRKILISASVRDEEIVLSTLDSISSGGGTWVATGDAENLTANSDDFVKGAASLKYDIGSGGTTTAGYKNTSLNTFDITEYLTNQIFHYVYISNSSDITSYTIRIGSSTSDYYQQTVTQTHEGTAFSVGWNLLRFDLSTATTVGTPVSDSCDYVEVFMTKSAGKVNQTGFRGDHIWAKKGEVYEIVYYSKYPWQSIAGTYLLNSTSDSDYVVADEDEIEIIGQKCVEFAAAEVDETDREVTANKKYMKMKDDYETDNPSEAKLIVTSYYDF